MKLYFQAHSSTSILSLDLLSSKDHFNPISINPFSQDFLKQFESTDGTGLRSLQNYCLNLTTSCSLFYDDGTPYYFDASVFFDSASSPVVVDNVHTKGLRSNNFSHLKPSSLIKTADLMENKGVGNENIEAIDASWNIKASTFKRMARLAGT